MGNIVIKMAGAGLIDFADHDTMIPWHRYRGIHIDTKFFSDLLNTLKELEKTEKIFLACGSTGSFLYTDLAKILHITSGQFLDCIGISMTNIIIKIITEFFSSNGLSICPYSIECEKLSGTQIRNYNIFFISPQEKFNSSDHLAALAAQKLQASHIFFIKQGIPYFYVGFEKKTRKEKFSLSELLKISSNYKEQPGKKYMLDQDSIRILMNINSKKYFVSPNSITEVPNIIYYELLGHSITEIID